MGLILIGFFWLEQLISTKSMESLFQFFCHFIKEFLAFLECILDID